MKLFKTIITILALTLLFSCNEKNPVLNISDSDPGSTVEYKLKSYISEMLRRELGKESYEPVSWVTITLFNPGKEQSVVTGPYYDMYDNKNAKLYMRHKYVLKSKLDQREVWELYEYNVTTKSLQKIDKEPWLDNDNNVISAPFESSDLPQHEVAPITSGHKY